MGILGLVARTWAADFLDTFSNGVAGWVTPPGWVLVEQADQNVVFRGDSTPDIFARRTDVTLGRSWRIEMDLDFRAFYSGGRYGLGGLALFPAVNSGVQFEVNVTCLNGRNVMLESQWFEAGSGTWNFASGTAWIPNASSVYRLHVFRPLNADRLVVKLTGTNGFEHLTETVPIPVEVLNRMTVVGLRVNSGRVEFDNLRVVTPYDAPAAPVLIEQPQSLSRFRGSRAEFRVNATGPGPLKYQWWKDTSMIRGQTNDVLLIPSVLPVSAGEYWVEVRAGERTEVSDLATLTVIDGSLRLLPPDPAFPDRLRLDFRLPAGQAYTLQRSLNMSDWTDWMTGQGSSSIKSVDVTLQEGRARQGFRLVIP
ncbi:MAG: immunoglobulin domain-containing protein [Verrucomicrobiales bacterium]|nr:immunoglobulin domain-containing protein [Verrucomicrobiales bacterium]